MNYKKFILNADDFGMSNAFNKAVIDGYNKGFLSSASICANGQAFSPAVNEILPDCPNLGLGVHLNIIEGNSLLDGDRFTKGYLEIISLSKNIDFMAKVEKEFRLQIERVLESAGVDHLDSHVHVHAIPEIFELTCKLAKEYGIKQVRTQREKFYLTPDIKKHLNFRYPPNILKIILLNYFTLKNRETVKRYGLETNDYIVGVGYTGMMDDRTIFSGLSAIREENVTVEALIHPCNYSSGLKNQHFTEFLITQNLDLKDKVQRLGFEIGNYKS